MNWTKILTAFSAWLPTVEKVTTETIAVSAAIKEAAQEAQAWTADHEAIHQAAADKLMASATKPSAPASGNGTAAETAPLVQSPEPAPSPIVFSEPTAEAKPEAQPEQAGAGPEQSADQGQTNS